MPRLGAFFIVTHLDVFLDINFIINILLSLSCDIEDCDIEDCPIRKKLKPIINDIFNEIDYAGRKNDI